MNDSCVYVGIVTFRSARLIRKCLDAVLRQTYKNIRITVLDNASGDRVGTIVRSYGTRVRFISNGRNAGYGSGHNAILGTIPLRDEDYYVTVNPDAVLDPRCIARLVDCSEQHASGWATGKLVRNARTKELYSVGHAIFRDGYAYTIGNGIVDVGQYDRAREVFGAPGAVALYSGKLIRSISVDGNFFDPAIFMYYEDIDVDWRAQRAGFRCWYEPRALAVHPGGVFPDRLVADVLGNRFLTVVKNSAIHDLFFFNIWFIVFHTFLRLIVTPKTGIRIVSLLLSGIPHAVSLRSTPTGEGSKRMHAWFQKAGQESSVQPRTFLQRLAYFYRYCISVT